MQNKVENKMTSAPNNTESTLASFIWSNANDLWGDFPHTEFGKIILPFTVLRRLECVLEPTKDVVLNTYEQFKDQGMALCSGLIQQDTFLREY